MRGTSTTASTATPSTDSSIFLLTPGLGCPPPVVSAGGFGGGGTGTWPESRPAPNGGGGGTRPESRPEPDGGGGGGASLDDSGRSGREMRGGGDDVLCGSDWGRNGSGFSRGSSGMIGWFLPELADYIM